MEFTEGDGSTRDPRLAKAIVYFRDEGRRQRRVVVTMGINSASAGALRISSWAPPGHPVRRNLPRDLRETATLLEPDHEGRDAVRTAPTCETIRLEPANRVAVSALAVGCLVGSVVGLVRWWGRSEFGWWILDAALVAYIAAAPWFLWRVHRVRIELTDLGIRSFGFLADGVYSRAEIADFRCLYATNGTAVRLTLAGTGSRYLAACASYDGHGEVCAARLNAWLREAGRAGQEAPGAAKLEQSRRRRPSHPGARKRVPWGRPSRITAFDDAATQVGHKS